MKVCYKVSLCEYCQRQSCKHSLVYLSVQKWVEEDVPYYVKIWPKLVYSFKNADFQSIFARSASAVTHSEKNQVHYQLSHAP